MNNKKHSNRNRRKDHRVEPISKADDREIIRFTKQFIKRYRSALESLADK